ncbi:hypothetical protein C5748_06685 [Phyllobacterium phragmitis]|uniref:Uncharacterized protein n=1 Tax=Phyllobacterium phragmitis TaxID=2670329 RepID=A0A2S9IUQ5_9HYPH|nr:hypothetical protein [Phyllobacterium phragmitis]PRD44273.1 hypothetical protein C5748_06685 [Phyllobacterium phragmitis]
MKTFTLTIAALAFSAGAAFAENPNLGIPAYLQDPTQLGTDHMAQPAIDYTATSDIGASDMGVWAEPSAHRVPAAMDNPAANRFSDASPKIQDDL